MSRYGSGPEDWMGIMPWTDYAKERDRFNQEHIDFMAQFQESIQEKLLEEIPPTRPVVSRAGRIHLSRIYGVFHEEIEDGIPLYKAVSINTRDNEDQSTWLTVPQSPKDFANTTSASGYVEPLTRPVMVPPLAVEDADGPGGGPAGRGELCLIVIDQFASVKGEPPVQVHSLMLWENITTRLCPGIEESVSLPANVTPGSIFEQMEDVIEEQRRSQL